MRCLHCGKRLSLLRKFSDAGFCSSAHRDEYFQQQNDLALARLVESSVRQPVREAPSRARAAASRKAQEPQAPPAAGAIFEPWQVIDAGRRIAVPATALSTGTAWLLPAWEARPAAAGLAAAECVDLPAPAAQPRSGELAWASQSWQIARSTVITPDPRAPCRRVAAGLRAATSLARLKLTAWSSPVDRRPEDPAVSPAIGNPGRPRLILRTVYEAPRARQAQTVASLASAREKLRRISPPEPLRPRDPGVPGLEAGVARTPVQAWLPASPVRLPAFALAAGPLLPIAVPGATAPEAQIHRPPTQLATPSRPLPPRTPLNPWIPSLGQAVCGFGPDWAHAMLPGNPAMPVGGFGHYLVAARPRRPRSRGKARPMHPALGAASLAAPSAMALSGESAARPHAPAGPEFIPPPKAGAVLKADAPPAAVARLRPAVPADIGVAIALPALSQSAVPAEPRWAPAGMRHTGVRRSCPAPEWSFTPPAAEVVEPAAAPAPLLPQLPLFQVRPADCQATRQVREPRGPLVRAGSGPAAPAALGVRLQLPLGPLAKPAKRKRGAPVIEAPPDSPPPLAERVRAVARVLPGRKALAAAAGVVLLLGAAYSFVRKPTKVLTGSATKAVQPGASESPAWFRKIFAGRAAVRHFDDFRSGLGAWQGAEGWSKTWSYSESTMLEPGQLALYTPTLKMTDYSMEFLGQIERRSLNWVVRAEDPANYYALRIIVTRGGPTPTGVLTRYPVSAGKQGSSRTMPLPPNIALHSGTLLRVRTDVEGSQITVRLQDQVVDSFGAPTHPRGGVGFFTPKGDRSLLRWVEVLHQYDYLGRFCALFAPGPQLAEGR
jgi:hypothetical protein